MHPHLRARLRALLVALVLLAGSASPGAAQSLTIAAASDLQGVLPQIVSRFEAETRQTTRVVFGSSGNFFSQIQNGAPFDLYLSADIDYPRRLEQAGLAEPGSLYHYATGRIVLWALKEKAALLGNGLPGLTAAGVKRIAIANPDHAPYGRAAVAALRSAGVYDQVRSKLVLGENVSQAAQFVESGNADVGIIALSIAKIPAIEQRGTSLDLPASGYPPIDQAAVIVKASKLQPAARRFMAFLQTPAIVDLMRRYGFAADNPPAAAR